MTRIERQRQQDVQVGRCLIMLLIAICIFAATLAVVFHRADTRGDAWWDEPAMAASR